MPGHDNAHDPNGHLATRSNSVLSATWLIAQCYLAPLDAARSHQEFPRAAAGRREALPTEGERGGYPDPSGRFHKFYQVYIKHGLQVYTKVLLLVQVLAHKVYHQKYILVVLLKFYLC